MRCCHLCVHTLPWLRKHGHINGTLPERLFLMFAYTCSPARLPPMCAYVALAPHMCPYFSFAPKAWTSSWPIAKTVATHVYIQVDTWGLPTMCPHVAWVPNVWTHSWRLGGVWECLGTALKRLGGCVERGRDIGFALTYRCVECVGLRCVRFTKLC